MKCQKLLISGLCVLALTTSPIHLFACDHSSQADTGGSSSDKGDSKKGGDTRAGSAGAASGTSGHSSVSDSNGNGPSNFQLINCSDPFWSDFMPCFERMTKSREAFVSYPD